MNWQDLLFEAPQAALLLPFVFLFLLLFFLLFIYRQISLEKFAGPQALSSILEQRSTLLYWLKSALFLLAWLFAVIALMEPMSVGRYPEQLHGDLSLPRQEPHEITFLIDVSSSMSVTDTPSQKSRLEVAKEIIDEVISSLQGQTTALLAFTSDVLELSPSTYDYLYVRLVLREVKIDAPGIAGTDFEKTFEQLSKQFQDKPKELKKTIYFISDGEDQRIAALGEKERHNAISKMVSGMNPEEHLLTINTIGIGSLSGGIVAGITYQGAAVRSSLHADILKSIAEAGRGKYYDGSTVQPFALAKTIVNEIETSMRSEIRDVQDQLIHNYYFQIPLALAILCLSLFLLLPDRMRQGLALAILFGPIALFGENGDLFLMEKAKALAESSQYEQAKIIYQDLLQEAVQPWERAVLMFNIATVLTEEGRWNQAEEIFKSISFDNELGPLLAYKTKQNLVYIAYQEAQKDALHFNERLNEVIALQKQAQAAFCVLQKAKGYASCDDSSFEQKLNYLLQQKLQFNAQSIPAMISQAPWKENLEWLKAIATEANDDLIFLQELQEESLQNRYLDLFSKRLFISQELLQKLFQQTDQLEEGKRSEAEHLLIQTETKFQDGIKQMEGKNWEESIEAFKEAGKLIEALMALPPPSRSESDLPSPQGSESESKQTQTEKLLRNVSHMNQQDGLLIPSKQLESQKVDKPW